MKNLKEDLVSMPISFERSILSLIYLVNLKLTEKTLICPEIVEHDIFEKWENNSRNKLGSA